jgi:hypothetical protein
MISALRRRGAARPTPTPTPPTGGGPDPADPAHDRAARPTWLRALRRHWLVAALLTVGLLLRVAAQLAYRPALFYIDTTRYLYPGDGQGNDPVGYRVPLRLIAQVANLDAVAAVQHLLGLAMAMVLYGLLIRRGAARWLAALAVAPVLLDGYQLQAEQTLMPDVLFEALIVAGLAALLWRPVTTLAAVSAGGLVFGLAVTVRQVGEILIVPALIFVLARAGGWRRTAGQAVALCVAFAVPILVYCGISLAATGHFWLSHTGVTTTYGRMAAAADCRTLRLPADERALCPTPAQRALGIDGLEHSPHSPLRPYYLSTTLPAGGASRLVSAFNHQVLRQQPLRVLRAYGRDLTKLFAVTRTTSPGDTPISRWQFQDHYPTYAPHAGPRVLAGAARRFGGGRPAVWRPVASFLRSYQLDGGYTPGPLLALAALLGLAGALSLIPAQRRRRAPEEEAAARRQLGWACLLLLLTGAGLLLVSDLFEFSWRYQLPALITLPPAGAAGVACLLRSARRPPAAQAAPAPAAEIT